MNNKSSDRNNMSTKSLEILKRPTKSTPEDKVKIKLKSEAKKDDSDDEYKIKVDQSKDQESNKKIPHSIHENDKTTQSKD